MRLWVLEEGDGDDAGIGHADGGRPIEIPPDPEEQQEEIAANAALEILPNVPEIFEPDEPEEPRAPRPELEREAPLVLRINQVVPPAPAVPDPPPAANLRQRGPQQRQQPQNGRGNPAPARGRGQWPRRREPNARQQARDALAPGVAEQEEANQRWVQMFVQMALNDEEDQLDSDDEEDPAAWEIPVR